MKALGVPRPIRRTRGLFLFLICSLLVVFILIFMLFNRFDQLQPNEGDTGRVLFDPKISEILATTPNLWGYRGMRTPQSDTIPSRINAQREWVKAIAGTNFIKKAKPKKILVYLQRAKWKQYWFTQNELKCPYAPEFEDKCVLHLEQRPVYQLLRQHPPQSYYRALGVDGVVGIRDGYFGRDVLHSEPQLPNGIHQIFYTTESPCHTGSARLGENGAWSASYWRGSDIPVPYREFMEIPTKDGNGSASTNLGSDDRKLVAALISNCVFVENNRLGYIAELRKYIPVAVFGSCGDEPCPKGCKEYLGAKYKFFLAFENCNCEDYISEKFFVNALEHNMVPVVMGGRRENYESSSPPHSFIHVSDFPSPKELAGYLNLLDRDDELYSKYMDWRGSWKLSIGAGADFFCRLCGMLYYADFQPPPPYPNNSTRWKDLNQCLPKNVWDWPI